ncbi:RNA methyltransferase [Cardinium endosymbiont of Oedothorax gibbosus]|uniref:RNA methyltransferase n=1 Tax=Cardinium endosymbiont of Oedothorax gibbosus TaxID=931101 RepID=UPI002024B59D|nr:RNA methyltransferase [Cardinium endosymbiont of Oedothorax gibbosus]CAH2560197.1 Putative rRNA methyltransferase, SpoU type [Cardinium endosymbiont of Oedothorax gibbosus]
MYSTLSKKKATAIRQFALKKYRLAQAAFVLEGKKGIQALLASDYAIKYIVGTSTFFEENQDIPASIRKETELFEVKKELLSRLGSFVHNHEVLAVAAIPRPTAPCLSPSGMTLALDSIQDPGNLGTIIRIADWYGIATILCSQTTVDLYNPKVLQASMGSFVKVNLHYVDLPHYLQGLNLPILGATLDGKPLHDFLFPNYGVLVIGNESHGIQPAVKETLTAAISIPRYGHANSLNAATATAILCDNWKRICAG